MTMQDVNALPSFNPHGGPITHSFQDRNPTLLYTLLSKLFLALGFAFNSRATFLMLYSGIRRNTYSRCSETFLTLVQTSSNHLSTWNLLLYLRTLLLMYSICSTREILICSYLGNPQKIFPCNILSL